MPRTLLSVVLLLALLAGCTQPEPNELTIYSGRSKSLVAPLIGQYTEGDTSSVAVRYGETAQLAAALQEEGGATQADVFYGQDAGALGALDAAGLLMPLPDSLLNLVPPAYRSSDSTWIATSGRARTLAYAPQRVDTMDLPQSVFDLTEARYEGRVGWAPTNGSFQAFVTAMRQQVSDDSTRAWLEAMQENDAQAYASNSAIVQAIADGEIDFGLPNHYYLYRFRAEDPDFPVAQTFFEAGDPGNLVNVAGVGVLQNTDAPREAMDFVAFLLSEEAQQYFANETYEYPVVEGVRPNQELQSLDELRALQPEVDLSELEDLEGTLTMLRDVGLI